LSVVICSLYGFAKKAGTRVKVMIIQYAVSD